MNKITKEVNALTTVAGWLREDDFTAALNNTNHMQEVKGKGQYDLPKKQQGEDVGLQQGK